MKTRNKPINTESSIVITPKTTPATATTAAATAAATTATDQSKVDSKQSNVWVYFERVDDDKELKAKCLFTKCGKVLATPLHSTSTLIRHLRGVHKLDIIKTKEKLVNRQSTKKISLKLKKQFDHAVLVAIIEDGRSFNDFDKKGFKKLIRLIRSDYTMPHRNTISKRLKRLHTKCSISLIDSLSKVSFIAISTDFWSDLKGASYLVLTGHFMSDNLCLNSTVLRFSTFEKRHFSDLIGIEIQNQLIELDIFDKVVSITCDAAPNMVKMFGYFSRPDINRIRCQAHLLHLIVCNGLGLWIEKKKKKNTAAQKNPIDPEERLSQSLKKVNLFDAQELSDDDELTTTSDDGYHNESSASQSGQEDIDEDESSSAENPYSSDDDDDESNSIHINSDDDDTDEIYEDNFEVGVDTERIENVDENSTGLDPRIDAVITKSRELIKMIKYTMILSSFVKKLLVQYNEQQDQKNKIKRTLVLDVRTRWNSTYKMIKTLFMYRFIIMDLFQKKTSVDLTKAQQQHLSTLEFTCDCWHIIELLINVLKPFYAATKVMSGSIYPTVGLAFYAIRRIEKEFLSVRKPNEDELTTNMKSCLLRKMCYYYAKDESQGKTLAFFAYFDPFAVSIMGNRELNQVETQIKSSFRHQSSNNSTHPITTSSNNQSNANGESTKTKNKRKSLISYFDSVINGEDVQEIKNQTATVKALNEEFKLYRKLAVQYVAGARDSYETLSFWKQNQMLLPNLMSLAYKHLASPGTSVKAESAFSVSAYYGRKQRARLSSENLCYSIFLKDKLSNQMY